MPFGVWAIYKFHPLLHNRFIFRMIQVSISSHIIHEIPSLPPVYFKYQLTPDIRLFSIVFIRIKIALILHTCFRPNLGKRNHHLQTHIIFYQRLEGRSQRIYIFFWTKLRYLVRKFPQDNRKELAYEGIQTNVALC